MAVALVLVLVWTTRAAPPPLFTPAAPRVSRPLVPETATPDVIERALRKLREELARLPKIPPEAQARLDAIRNEDLLPSLRRAKAIFTAVAEANPPFLGAKLAELRSIRRGFHLDPERCTRTCTTPKAICVPDLSRCAGGAPPECAEICKRVPETVCETDWNACTPPVPATCEKKCTPGAAVCRTELYDCTFAGGCKSRQVDCKTADPVCVDDPTRCSEPIPPQCPQVCQPGPEVCAPDPTKCKAAKLPECESKCTTPPEICGPPDCRARNPIDTGYDPRFALSAAGRAKLAKKEPAYQALAARHFVDGQIIIAAADPTTVASASTTKPPRIVEFHNSRRNASGATGHYLAAAAYKYGVTGSNVDLERLHRVLTGVYYLTTIASAPQSPDDPLAPRGVAATDGLGTKTAPILLIHKDDPTCKVNEPGKPKPVGRWPVKGKCKTFEPTRRGVWVRSFAGGWDNASEVRPEARADSWGDFTWGFIGRLPGLETPDPKSPWGPAQACDEKGKNCRPLERYHFEAEQSRDNVDPLLFGLAAAYEVLSLRKPDDPWRARIGRVVLEFLRTLIANDYRLVDLDGTFPKWGNQTVWPGKGEEDPGGDPTNMIEVLGWLKIGVFVTDDPELKAEYKRRVDQHIRGRSVDSVFRAFDPLIGGFVRNVPELVELGGPMPRYRPAELMLAIHPLIRHENDPLLRKFYVGVYERILHPLTNPMRVPLFDAMYLVATSQPDAPTLGVGEITESVRGRMAATLLQYRDKPFVKPPSPASLGCQDDSSPILTSYATDACKPKLASPFYEAFVLANEEHLHVDAINDMAGGIWPLGWGIVPTVDEHWGSGAAHGLRGTLVEHDGRVFEPPGYDFLLQYWFARFHGLL